MKIRKEFIVGIFASLGIASLILGFFFLKGHTFFGGDNQYYAIYPSAEGVSVGTEVKLNGIGVGNVTDVILNPNNDTTTLITFKITNESIKMPVGTMAEMSGGLLGAVVIKLLYPKVSDGTFHIPGDTIRDSVAGDLKQTLENKFDPLMGKIDELIATADTAISTIEVIFSNNTGNLNESFEGLNKAVRSFGNVAENLDSLTGALSGSRYKITALISNVESITNNLKESNDEITKMFTNVSSLTDSIAQMDLPGVVKNVKTTLDNVNLILDNIQNGDGTLTKLMQDSLLYNNLNFMVEEATRLVENIKQHPNRYLQFSVFGGRDKGPNLDAKQEQRLKAFVKDSLKIWYP